MTLREVWQTRKHESEEAFKKEHAHEVLKAATEGVTGYPLKFELGLGPALDNFESAKKKKKELDEKKFLGKSKEIVGKYKTRIDKSKTELGTAYEPLHKGITYLEAGLK
jgi:hypothetical protein